MQREQGLLEEFTLVLARTATARFTQKKTGGLSTARLGCCYVRRIHYLV
jgi:hypothetical protein